LLWQAIAPPAIWLRVNADRVCLHAQASACVSGTILRTCLRQSRCTDSDAAFVAGAAQMEAGFAPQIANHMSSAENLVRVVDSGR
jgi:hypothetical protein